MDMRRGGGIGFIVVIVAAAIVMILAMRAWLSVAPTAVQIMNPSAVAGGKGAKGKGKAPPKGIPDHGQADAAQQVQKGVLPDLNDMRQGTDQHAKEVGDALKESNK